MHLRIICYYRFTTGVNGWIVIWDIAKNCISLQGGTGPETTKIEHIFELS